MQLLLFLNVEAMLSRNNILSVFKLVDNVKNVLITNTVAMHEYLPTHLKQAHENS